MRAAHKKLIGLTGGVFAGLFLTYKSMVYVPDDSFGLTWYLLNHQVTKEPPMEPGNHFVFPPYLKRHVLLPSGEITLPYTCTVTDRNGESVVMDIAVTIVVQPNLASEALNMYSRDWPFKLIHGELALLAKNYMELSTLELFETESDIVQAYWRDELTERIHATEVVHVQTSRIEYRKEPTFQVDNDAIDIEVLKEHLRKAALNRGNIDERAFRDRQ